MTSWSFFDLCAAFDGRKTKDVMLEPNQDGCTSSEAAIHVPEHVEQWNGRFSTVFHSSPTQAVVAVQKISLGGAVDPIAIPLRRAWA
jgi:hypothetical protein